MLEIWRTHYFRAKDQETLWSGTVTDLIVELRNNEVLAKLPPRYTDYHLVGSALRQLLRAGVPWLTAKRTKEARRWEFTRPEKL